MRNPDGEFESFKPCNAEHCNDFVLPCSLMLEIQQQGFSMDTAKIIIISLLSGRALQ